MSLEQQNSEPLSIKDWLAGATVLITSFALGTSITNYTTSIRESLVEPLISPIIGSGPDKFTQVGPFKFKFVNLIGSTVQFGTMILVAYGMYRALQKATSTPITNSTTDQEKK